MRNALTLQSFYEKSMRKGLVIAIAVGILLGSCKDKKMENVFAIEDDVVEDSLEAYVGDTLHLFEDVEPPAAVDELFDDFLFNFIDDARFQGHRIIYPLPCTEGEEVTTLSKEDWADYDHFKDQELLTVIYEREHDLVLSKDTSKSSSVMIDGLPSPHATSGVFSVPSYT